MAMTRHELERLEGLANLVLDQRLAHLRQAADAKAQSEAALASLSASWPRDSDLIGASAELAELAYSRWADRRRAEINVILARQTHLWLEARQAASLAFGKVDALRRLKNR
jgi:hypothetical protein